MTQSVQEFPEVTVNGMRIDADQIAQELQYHHADSFDQALHQSMEALVVKALLIQEAQAKTLLPKDCDLNDDRVIEAGLEKLIEQEVSLPETNDDACYQYYLGNTERFMSQALIEARHILLACAPDDVENRIALREKAQDLIHTLQQQPEHFEALVKHHSDCPSKETGGHLGQLSQGSTVPEFEKAIMRLPVGLAKSPVESRYGFHIVDIAHRIDGEPLPFEQVHDKIRQYLQQSVYQKAINQFIQVLAGKSDITGFDINHTETPLVQ